MKRRLPGSRRESAFLTSDLLVERIHAKYPSREYAFFTQVASNTGGPADRTADALAMALWPSRGLVLVGFEVKAHRSDWIRELRNPEKAERIAKYCDFWWIAANDGIVAMDELPANWGLMVPSEDGLSLRKVKDAEKLKPVALDRDFMAALMRNIGDTMVPRAAVAGQVEEAFKKGREEGESIVADVRELERLRAFETMVTTYEQATGLSLRLEESRWDGQTAKTVGAAVKSLLKGTEDMRWRVDAIEQIEKQCGELTDMCRDHLKIIRAAHAKLKAGEPSE